MCGWTPKQECADIEFVNWRVIMKRNNNFSYVLNRETNSFLITLQQTSTALNEADILTKTALNFNFKYYF